jgi:hypothetical protein
MIVIDTSTLVAILNHGPERTTFFEVIVAFPGRSAAGRSLRHGALQAGSRCVFAMRLGSRFCEAA